jgi:flagellar M-ring protein FliF
MEQLKKILASLSMRQRITIVAVALAVGFGLTALLQWRKEADFKPLFTGLAPEDTAAVVQKLKESSAEYRIGEGGRSVSVASAKVAELRLEMAAAGLPKTGRVGFEIFDKNNLGATEFVEHINYQRAVEGELERSVMALSEVEHARVHVTFAKNSVFVSSREPAKASVLVKLKPGAALSERNVLAVRHLVAAAVEGLTADGVSVVDMAGNILSRPRTADEEAQAAAFDYRQKIEHDLLKKINTTLDPLLGKDRYRANVMVDVDLSSGEQSEETVDPSQSVLVTSQSTEESTNLASSAGASGVPGTASNLPRPMPRSGAGGGVTTRRTENVAYQSSRTTRTLKIAQGAIKRISAGVLLDQDLRWDGAGPSARRVLVPPSAETIKSVRDVVAAVVGFSEEREDKITVESLPFESTLRAPPPPAPGSNPPASQQPAGFLAELQKNPKMLIGLVAAVVLLLAVVGGVIWMVLKSRKKAGVATEGARELAAANEAEAQAALEAGAAPPQLAAAPVAALAPPEPDESDLSYYVPSLKLPAITKKTKAMARHIREQCSHDSTTYTRVLQSWINETN